MGDVSPGRGLTVSEAALYCGPGREGVVVVPPEFRSQNSVVDAWLSSPHHGTVREQSDMRTAHPAPPPAR